MLTVFQTGEERLLLETRRRVLEKLGLAVVTAMSAEEALAQIPALQFDLAILCHSLPADRRRQIAAALRKLNPAAPILLVGREPGGLAIDEDAAIDAVVDPHPERLTQTLSRLLQLKQRSSAVRRSEEMPAAAD